MAEEPVSSRDKASRPSGGKGTPKNPVFFRYPMGWSDWSEEEKDRFLDEVATAIMEKSKSSS
jgi:hypothetical protein